MKILNLYSGIGGNRKLWGNDHEITAVERDENISKIYSDFFPNDQMIIGDAHEYLLNHYNEYDFIWSSPPCPSHSDIRRTGVHKGLFKAIYPEMSLYQEIILLKHFCKNLWAVENVKPYYVPLIFGKQIERHLFWSNFRLDFFDKKDKRKHRDIKEDSLVYGFDLSNYKAVKDKRKILRNCVDPELGKYILDCVINTMNNKFVLGSLFE